MILRIYNTQDKNESDTAFWEMQLEGYRLYCAIEDLQESCDLDDPTYEWLEDLKVKLSEIDSGDLDYDE